MSLIPQLAQLLHPSQVLTVKQAYCLVQQLIDHFTETVGTLPRHPLDYQTEPDYQACLEELIQHASVLEQILCRICFFLPGEVVETVVAVVVLTHYQLSLLESTTPSINGMVLTPQNLTDMSDYLEHVFARLDRTSHWVHSDDYVTLTNAARDILAEMRASYSSYISSTQERDNDLTTMSHFEPSRPSSVLEDLESARFHELHSRLANLLPLHSADSATSIVEADRDILYRNFIPFVFSNSLPYRPPESYACGETDTGRRLHGSFSSSTTAVSSSSRPSRNGKERATTYDLPEPPPDQSLPRADLPPAYDMPFPLIPYDAEPVHPLPHADSRKRRRSRGENSSARKRPRVSITLYGVDGCQSDCSTHEAATARVRPWIRHAVPFSGNLSPSRLPRTSRDLLAACPSTVHAYHGSSPSTSQVRERSTSPSEWSTSAQASFNQAEDPFYPDGLVIQDASDYGQFSVPSPPSWSSDEGADADIDMDDSDADAESFVTASSSATSDDASVVGQAGSVAASTSSPVPPVLTLSTASTPTPKRRRCFDGFLTRGGWAMGAIKRITGIFLTT